jgi:hypothetical protein
MQKIKQHFYLKRIEDESGVSGTGIVAIGVVLPSGQCVLEWLTFTSSIAIYKNIEAVEEIHGHHGKTLVVLGDPDDKTTNKRRTSRNSKPTGSK